MSSLSDVIKEKLSGAHDFSHIERVLSHAEKINVVSKGNWKIIYAALLIHEVGKNDLASCKDYFPDFSEEEIKQVKYCIEKHSDYENKPQTIEGKIVQDADILDMLGAVGIARGFIASGEKKYNLKTAKDEYKKKRLNVINQLTLEESKKLAKNKIEFTKLFFTTLDEELSEG
jgi:uncharacterized protein